MAKKIEKIEKIEEIEEQKEEIVIPHGLRNAAKWNDVYAAGFE